MQRRTRQKAAIEDVIEHSPSPLTPLEILDQAMKSIPRMGLATIYRTLKSLLEEGRVRIVEIPGQTPRYESADRGRHHHFLCRTCGRVFDLGRCLPGIKSMAPRSFVVEDHDITLYGRCDQC